MGEDHAIDAGVVVLVWAERVDGLGKSGLAGGGMLGVRRRFSGGPRVVAWSRDRRARRGLGVAVVRMEAGQPMDGER